MTIMPYFDQIPGFRCVPGYNPWKPGPVFRAIEALCPASGGKGKEILAIQKGIGYNKLIVYHLFV